RKRTLRKAMDIDGDIQCLCFDRSRGLIERNHESSLLTSKSQVVLADEGGRRDSVDAYDLFDCRHGLKQSVSQSTITCPNINDARSRFTRESEFIVQKIDLQDRIQKISADDRSVTQPIRMNAEQPVLVQGLHQSVASDALDVVRNKQVIDL